METHIFKRGHRGPGVGSPDPLLSLGYWLRRIHQTLISVKGEEKNGGRGGEKEVEVVIQSKGKGEETRRPHEGSPVYLAAPSGQ